MSERPTRVVIAGGGVAALELTLGLRALANERVEIKLLSAEREFVYRPLAVAEPFDVGKAHRFDLAAIVEDSSARLSVGALAAVDAERRHAVTADGRQIGFDILAVAVGARPREALPGALTFAGQESHAGFRRLLEELGRGGVERLVFAVPGGTAWALPLYELALMTSTYAAARRIGGVRITLVTPEDAPLALFGRRASDAVRALLDERGITVRAGAYPARVEDGRLVVTPGEPVAADHVVTLPALEGPRLAGVPHDAGGFIPTDPYGLVEGLDGVYAAGDATTFPVKQGGSDSAGGRGRPVDRRPRRRAGNPGALPAGSPRPAPHRQHAGLPAGRAARRPGRGVRA